jgi:hypothetical protein
MNKPGAYLFYLYSENGLGIKDVHVLDKKDFQLGFETVISADLDSRFGVNVTLKNLIEDQNVELKIQFTNQSTSTKQFFRKGQDRSYYFEFEANRDGANELVVSAAGNSLASETKTIFTAPRPRSFLDGISDFIASLLNSLSLLFN